MNQSIVCIYTFDLNAGVSAEQLLQSSAKVDSLLLKTEGFVYRSMTRTDAGRWQDIIYWQSEQACANSKSLEATPTFDEFMTLIDTKSVSFTKAAIHSQVYPEMNAA